MFAALGLGACGGDDGGSTTTTDAPVSSGNSVTTVDCATNAPTATVATMNFMFTPQATTITAGQVVKFQLESSHDVVPDTSTTTDPGLAVGFGATACLKFAKAGTFGFKCMPHNFTGSIKVN
jgi:plastocyanin